MHLDLEAKKLGTGRCSNIYCAIFQLFKILFFGCFTEVWPSCHRVPFEHHSCVLLIYFICIEMYIDDIGHSNAQPGFSFFWRGHGERKSPSERDESRIAKAPAPFSADGAEISLTKEKHQYISSAALICTNFIMCLDERSEWWDTQA